MYVLCIVSAIMATKRRKPNARLGIVFRSADEQLRRVIRVDETEEPTVSVNLQFAPVHTNVNSKSGSPERDALVLRALQDGAVNERTHCTAIVLPARVLSASSQAAKSEAHQLAEETRAIRSSGAILLSSIGTFDSLPTCSSS